MFVAQIYCSRSSSRSSRSTGTTVLDLEQLAMARLSLHSTFDLFTDVNIGPPDASQLLARHVTRPYRPGPPIKPFPNTKTDSQALSNNTPALLPQKLRRTPATACLPTGTIPSVEPALAACKRPPKADHREFCRIELLTDPPVLPEMW